MERPAREHEKVFGQQWMTHEITVSGEVNHPLTLTADDLRGMEMTEVNNVGLICGSGRHDGIVKSYRGVRLTAVLERAEVKMKFHDSPNYLYVTVVSSDHHWAIFSYQELFNSAVGEQAVVIVERDGQPLDEKEGEIAFISANDVRPGPRRLRYLSHIQVHEHQLENGE
ncbi:MAG: molybdopterin-dependent oxidoreductase [Acidobacteriota bacterium]|nr:molybdopterin-dependent oxidoreductase [Acidobacteriota bacterium]